MPQPAWVKGRLGSEPYLSRLFYGLILKRSSTYMTAVMITATTVGAQHRRAPFHQDTLSATLSAVFAPMCRHRL